MQLHRSSRSGAYLTWRMHVEDAYRAAGMHTEADRWATCSDPAMFFTPQARETLPAEAMSVVTCSDDPSHFTKTLCPSCDFRTCPDCAHRHSARLLDRYMPILRQCIDNPRRDWEMKHITLTTAVKLTQGDVKAQIGALYANVRTLFENLLKTAYKRPVAMSEVGLIVALEFGHKGQRLHFHCLYYGPWIYQSALSLAWEQLTGYPVVWIDGIGEGQKHESLESAVAEVLKYTTKFWKLDREGKALYIDPKLVPVMHEALAGTRRIRSWGLFYNAAEAKEQAACPTCKSPLCILSKTEYEIYRETGWMPSEFASAVSSTALFNLRLADKSASSDPPDIVSKGKDAYELRADVLSHRLTNKIEGNNPQKPKTRRPAETPSGELLL